MNQSFTFFICMNLILMMGCKRAEISHENPRLTPPIISTAAAPITASIQGNVLNENGDPESGVTITVDTKTTTTDLNGYFRIDHASLDKNASLLTGEKAGYFNIVKTFAATSGVNYQKIKLLKKNLLGTIPAASGGTVSLDDGNSLTLAAGTIVKKADNSAYDGIINVYGASIDPTAQDFVETVPGSLMANDSSGKRVMLKSYGMLALELESATAEPLQLATGKTATLDFNIPPLLQNTAPSTIALWYIDNKGLWIEQGSASRSGNTYTGEVSHFSFWNCDSAMNSIMLNLTVNDNQHHPVQYALVSIHSKDYNTTYGYTDSLGQVSGLVPFNGQLGYSISSSSYCMDELVAETIGPFTQSSNLTITLDSLSTVKVSGKLLNCDDAPLNNGYALIYHKNIRYIASVDTAGNFHIRVIKCGANDNISIFGIDSSGKQQNTPKTFPIASTSVDVGNISVCGVSTVQFINYTVDGVQYLLNEANHSTVTEHDTLAYNGTHLYFEISGNNKAQKNSIYFDIEGDPGKASSLATLNFTLNNKYFGATHPDVISLSLTNYAKGPGEYFEGSFTGNFSDGKGQAHTIHCTFRLRRN